MKSTHKGHCQACGRLQMLPSGKLAKHGYNVKHGFFSGVCAGSGSLPFEQSYDLLPHFIANAQIELDSLNTIQSKLRLEPVEPKAWVSNYEGESYGHNNYHWRFVDVQSEVRSIVMSDGKPHEWTEYFYIANGTNGAKDVRHKIDLYDYKIKGVLNTAWALNKTRADAFDREITSLRRYIAWQNERIATWKLMPLLPVNVKDKEGFVVNV